MRNLVIASFVVLAAALPACGGNGSSSTSGTTSHGGSGGAASTGTTTSSTGAAGGAAGSCGAYTPGDDLHVCTASYLGGSGADHVAAIDVAADGSVLIGGAIAGTDLGATPAALLGGGDGAVVRLDPQGRTVRGLARLGGAVRDLEVSRKDGRIAAAGDFGVAVLSPDAAALVWHDALGGAAASRVAVGSDGTVAALAGKTVTVFSAAGSAIGTIPITATAVNDVAVDGASQSVLVTGYRQDDGGACSQYKSTFLRSHAYAGALKWKAYDWTHDDVGASGDCADTQGLALAIGRDGKLYYAGKSDGGNTVHQKDPRDLSQAAPNVGFDQYNKPYGFKGANAIGYYARFDPATGAIDKGQFVVARKGSDPSAEGNACTPSAIAADEKGNVYVAGDSAYEIAGHDAKTIDGVPVGPYVAYEAFALIVPPDFSSRLTWTVFTKTGPADAKTIAAAQGVVAFGAEQADTQLAKGTLLTANALQGAPAGGASEGYFAVWPAP
jgi:hypothetical protein